MDANKMIKILRFCWRADELFRIGLPRQGRVGTPRIYLFVGRNYLLALIGQSKLSGCAVSRMYFSFEKRVAFCGARNAAIISETSGYKSHIGPFANITRDSLQKFGSRA
jgi:hypothetical protein